MEAQGSKSLLTEKDVELAGKPAAFSQVFGSGNKLRMYIVLVAVWVLAGGYAGSHLMRGWVPHDEGAFAQSADRVLHGDMPHRDYTEIYTGGLAYLHAFAFRYLGENFATLRIVLFAFFLIWVPAFYWVATRLVRDWIAGCVTLLAVVWSFPNYPAAVPSWYNLFFATFGLAALFGYLSRRADIFLFIAGLCGGCSFLAKSTALYYFASVFLFLLFSEQCESEQSREAAKRRGYLYSAFAFFSILAFLMALAALIRGHGNTEQFIEFMVPSSILAIFLLHREFLPNRGPSRERFQTLFRSVLPFSLGAIIPLVGFLIPYLRANAFQAVASGVFVVPFRRIVGAYGGLPGLVTIWPSIVVVGTLILSARFRGITRIVIIGATGFAVSYYLFLSAYNPEEYRVVWHSAYWITPMIALAGGYALHRQEKGKSFFAAPQRASELYLVLAFSCLWSLVQYPFSGPIYFCYVAPLSILAAVAVLREFPAIPKIMIGMLTFGFFMFAVLRVTPTFIYAMAREYQPDPETEILALPRAGNLKIEPASAKIYEQLIPLIQEHAGAAEIYATQDCPQIYFLAGYRNPTRALFEFFEPDYRNGQRILKLIDSRPIRVIVLNRAPAFSVVLPFDVHTALVRRFPQGKNVGIFEVRWRD